MQPVSLDLNHHAPIGDIIQEVIEQIDITPIPSPFLEGNKSTYIDSFLDRGVKGSPTNI